MRISIFGSYSLQGNVTSFSTLNSELKCNLHDSYDSHTADTCDNSGVFCIELLCMTTAKTSDICVHRNSYPNV